MAWDHKDPRPFCSAHFLGIRPSGPLMTCPLGQSPPFPPYARNIWCSSPHKPGGWDVGYNLAVRPPGQFPGILSEGEWGRGRGGDVGEVDIYYSQYTRGKGDTLNIRESMRGLYGKPTSVGGPPTAAFTQVKKVPAMFPAGRVDPGFSNWFPAPSRMVSQSVTPYF